MNEIDDFLFNLLPTGDCLPRCFLDKWTAFHGSSTVFSDLFIFVFLDSNYFSQTSAIEKYSPFLPLFWLFESFIIL
jgi:hypothetical protein